MIQSRVNGEDDYLVVGVLLSLGVLLAYYLFVFKLVVSNLKKNDLKETQNLIA